MNIPELLVPPKFDTPPSGILEPRAEKVAQWIDDLPLANPFDCVREVTHTLSQWNRVEIPPAKRLATMQVITPLVEEICPILHREYQDSPLPLTSRKKQRSSLVHDLWVESAYTYKLAFMNLILTQKAVVNPGEILIPSIYYAIQSLSNLLLECYLIYNREPDGLWRELHQLYAFAQANSIQDAELTQFAPQNRGTAPLTISEAYRRGLMLSLADPYHLMPGEINKFYAELSLWTQACTLTPLNKKAPAAGHYYIDFASDHGPRLAASHDLQAKTITSGILIDTKTLHDLAERRLDDETPGRVPFGAVRHTTLTERLQREMHQRLLHAWSPRKDRTAPRHPSKKQVVLVASLDACHHYASGGEPFNPEQDEYLIQQVANPAISVDKLEKQEEELPWLDDLGAVSSSAAPSSGKAVFGSEAGREVWDEIYHATFGSQGTEASEAANYPQAICLMHDVSRFGLSAEYSLRQSEVRTRVGDLIAVRPGASLDPAQGKANWAVGATRWLRTRGDEEIELGIEVLAASAQPVATRAVSGVGKGSNYFRGLIIPKTQPASKQRTTIITAPTVYDVETVILINTGDKLLYARLLKMLEGSKSFCRFEYRLLDEPPAGV